MEDKEILMNDVDECYTSLHNFIEEYATSNKEAEQLKDQLITLIDAEIQLEQLSNM